MSVGIGDALREAREEQDRTLEEAARALRVRTDILRAIEDERFEDLGGDVYAKGFLRQYAVWLHLDPEPLLDRYRRQVQRGDVSAAALIDHSVAHQPGSGPPSWLTWGLVTLIVLVAALAVIGLFGGRTPEPAAEPRTPVEATTAPTEAATAPSTDEPTQTTTPTPSPEPTAVDLALLFEEASWIRVDVGDDTVFQGTVAAGETREFDGPRVALRLGNAGGVRLILNGRPVDPVGGRGEVVNVVCTPEACEPAG